MAEKKNINFDRPGGYAMPKGATHVQSRIARQMKEAGDAGEIKLFGDRRPDHQPRKLPKLKPACAAADPDTRLYVGDCRDVLANRGQMRRGQSTAC